MFRYFARDKMGRDQKSFIYFANLQNLRTKKGCLLLRKDVINLGANGVVKYKTAWLRIFVWSFFFSFHVSCL